MTDWGKIRGEFPVTKQYAYFQSAAMSPLPSPVYQALIENYGSIHQFGDKTLVLLLCTGRRLTSMSCSFGYKRLPASS